MAIGDILDLNRYPIDRPDAPPWQALVARCRADLAARGLYSLAGLVRPDALTRAISEIKPLLDTASFMQSRRHNIYFLPEVPALAPDHPALKQDQTTNHTVCADQLPAESVVLAIYAWAPFAAFLAATMDKPALHPMGDTLARVNVMGYRTGEALGWHFDRSAFTTTLLLQAPEAGGAFQYRTGLRSDDDPNHDGVAALLDGRDPAVRSEPLSSGTLNVFRGRNTAHRVTPVRGDRERIIAVFAYFERPGVMFSAEERLGFYGRAA